MVITVYPRHKVSNSDSVPSPGPLVIDLLFQSSKTRATERAGIMDVGPDGGRAWCQCDRCMDSDGSQLFTSMLPLSATQSVSAGHPAASRRSCEDCY